MTDKTINRSEARRKSRERRLKRQSRLSQVVSKTSQAVSQAVQSMKTTITFEDLDSDQLKAYYGIHDWWRTQKEIGGVSKPLVVSGYAGCGKSALLSVALPALQNPDGSKVRVKYAAYTGKASNVLMTKNLDAQTIHSLIYECIPLPTGGFEFVLKERDEVEAELIVIDEASMVPEDMRKDLQMLRIPILYTGDHGQLPPVKGAGNVMDDPDFRLETPHRQALDSGIIQVATAIRSRQPVSIGNYGKSKDCEVVRAEAANDVDLLASADMVICYTNSKRSQLNETLREFKGFEGTYPMVGEKLICVRNNKITRMFNGLIVTVKAIKVEGEALLMDVVDEVGKEYFGIKAFKNYFEGHEHPMIKGSTMFDVFEYAYAITGHKSQGSQWDHVIVIEENMFRQPMSIKRRWKYTVLTRAVKRLTYVTLRK